MEAVFFQYVSYYTLTQSIMQVIIHQHRVMRKLYANMGQYEVIIPQHRAKCKLFYPNTRQYASYYFTPTQGNMLIIIPEHRIYIIYFPKTGQYVSYCTPTQGNMLIIISHHKDFAA